MEIGSVIREYRTMKKMTQEELAEALAVTSQAVSRWETGVSYPDIAMVPGIVKVLGVSADRLLGCDKREEKKHPEDKTIDVLNQDQIDCIFGDASSARKEPKTVLIIDDSDFMRMMLTDMLSHDRHKILQARSGEEGLEMLQNPFLLSREAVVCILDIMMPGMDGLETLTKIKESYPDIKVIMLSAKCGEETVRRALELGADSFVAKPFASSTLVERI